MWLWKQYRSIVAKQYRSTKKEGKISSSFHRGVIVTIGIYFLTYVMFVNLFAKGSIACTSVSDTGGVEIVFWTCSNTVCLEQCFQIAGCYPCSLSHLGSHERRIKSYRKWFEWWFFISLKDGKEQQSPAFLAPGTSCTGRQFFHELEVGPGQWFQDDSSTVYGLCTLFLLL